MDAEVSKLVANVLRLGSQARREVIARLEQGLCDRTFHKATNVQEVSRYISQAKPYDLVYFNRDGRVVCQACKEEICDSMGVCQCQGTRAWRPANVSDSEKVDRRCEFCLGVVTV